MYLKKRYNDKYDTSDHLFIVNGYLYKLYYVIPKKEIRLKIYKNRYCNLEYPGVEKYSDTHVLIAQYLMLPYNGKLYTEKAFNEYLFNDKKPKRGRPKGKSSI